MTALNPYQDACAVAKGARSRKQNNNERSVEYPSSVGKASKERATAMATAAALLLSRTESAANARRLRRMKRKLFLEAVGQDYIIMASQSYTRYNNDNDIDDCITNGNDEQEEEAPSRVHAPVRSISFPTPSFDDEDAAFTRVTRTVPYHFECGTTLAFEATDPSLTCKDGF